MKNYRQIKSILLFILMVPWLPFNLFSQERGDEYPIGNAPQQLDPEYHTFEEVYTFLDSIVPLYPDIVIMDTASTSHVKEFKIPVLKISDNPELEEDEPAIGYDGLIHSREPVSMEVCLKLIEYLLSNYGSNPQVTEWVDNIEVFIIPMLNPDGWNYVCEDFEENNYWYKNLHDNDSSGHFNPPCDGVNLNRNFDSNWEYGDPDPCSPRYRGAYPFSEKETQLKRKFASEQKYVLSVNYHSAPEDWDYNESVGVILDYLGQSNPEYVILFPIADSIAHRTPKLNLSECYDAQPFPCDAGFSDCWMIEKNGTLEFTIETAPELYPSGPDAMQIAEDNAMAALYLLNRVFGPGITGHVYDCDSGDPIVASIKVLEIDNIGYELEPKTSDSLYGRFFRMLNPGVYTVQAFAEGYDTVTVENVLVTDTLTEVDFCTVGVEESAVNSQQSAVRVYPNPTSGSSRFAVRSSQSEHVTIKIYDLHGRKVATVVDEVMPAGEHIVSFDAESLLPGVYIYRKLAVGNRQLAVGKLVKY
jgi:hypothetical protein